METKTTTERFKRPLVAVVGVGIGLAALTACARAEVEDNRPGTVVQHVFHDSYTSFSMVGKVPLILHHPERYELDVRQCDRSGDDFADAEGCVTAGVDVTKETYDTYADGSQIIFTR